MGSRKIKDDDLCRDIDDLRRSLEEAIHALSSFEKYMTEVDSGRLVNSPVHTEQFWRENTQKFEEKSFDYIK
jgi:V-type H+-transporting ATPase subunit H